MTDEERMQIELNELRVSVIEIAKLCVEHDIRGHVSSDALRDLLPAWAVAAAYDPGNAKTLDQIIDQSLGRSSNFDKMNDPYERRSEAGL